MRKTILLILFILFIACRKEFYYDFKHVPQVNVSCFIKAGDTVKLRLSYLVGDTLIGNILAEKDYITNAEVYLYENNIFKEKLLLTEVPAIPTYQKGWYFSQSFIPTEKHHYQVRIFVPGYDTVYAETYIPQVVMIDSVLINGKKTLDTIYYNGEDIYNINICFKDNEHVLNYYNYWSNVPFISYDPVIEPRSDKDYYEASTLNISKFAFFSDKIFDGNNYSLNTQVKIYPDNFDYYPNMPIEFKLYSLSYDTYAFYKSSYLYFKQLKNPLSEPVIIYSNIKNGTGIFAGISTSTDSVLITTIKDN